METKKNPNLQPTSPDVRRSYFLLLEEEVDFLDSLGLCRYVSRDVFTSIDTTEERDSEGVRIFDSLLRFSRLDGTSETLELVVRQGQEEETMTLELGKPREVSLDYVPEEIGMRCIGKATLTLLPFAVEDVILPGKIEFDFHGKVGDRVLYDEKATLSFLDPVRKDCDTSMVEGPDGMVYGVFAIGAKKDWIILYRFPQEDDGSSTSFLFLQTDRETVLIDEVGRGKTLGENSLRIRYIKPRFDA